MILSIETKCEDIQERLIPRTIEFYPGINVLIGCNGSGKSTLISLIESYNENLREMEILKSKKLGDIEKYLRPFEFAKVNIQENSRIMSTIRGASENISGKTEIRSTNDFLDTMNSKQLSEGQSNLFTVDNFIEVINNVLPLKEYPHIITIDEFDTGISVDNIEVLCKWMMKTASDFPLTQFVIAVNNYHAFKTFGNTVKYIDVINGLEWKPEDYSYDTFYNQVIYTRDSRNEWKKKHKESVDYLKSLRRNPSERNKIKMERNTKGFEIQLKDVSYFVKEMMGSNVVGTSRCGNIIDDVKNNNINIGDSVRFSRMGRMEYGFYERDEMEFKLSNIDNIENNKVIISSKVFDIELYLNDGKSMFDENDNIVVKLMDVSGEKVFNVTLPCNDIKNELKRYKKEFINQCKIRLEK